MRDKEEKYFAMHAIQNFIHQTSNDRSVMVRSNMDAEDAHELYECEFTEHQVADDLTGKSVSYWVTKASGKGNSPTAAVNNTVENVNLGITPGDTVKTEDLTERDEPQREHKSFSVYSNSSVQTMITDAVSKATREAQERIDELNELLDDQQNTIQLQDQTINANDRTIDYQAEMITNLNNEKAERDELLRLARLEILVYRDSFRRTEKFVAELTEHKNEANAA